jgi:glucokinase
MLTRNETIVLGLDIGGTHVRAALAYGRQIIASRGDKWPTGLSPDEELDFVADLALGLAGKERVSAAGVAMAALLDKDGNVVEWPNRTSWRGVPFRRSLAQRLNLPLVVEDDCNAAALAEFTFGAARGYRDVLVMMVGTGVGAGLILDGALFRGRQGWAGELGHMVMQADGPLCDCGHRGCLQMLASGRALERVAAQRGLKNAVEVSAAAERHESWAEEVLVQNGRWLGLAAANTVNMLDLEAVIVGGGLCRLGEPWWSGIEETLQTNLLAPLRRNVVVRRAELSDTAAVLGAISLTWHLSATA